jgi:hypothetical protein
LRVILTGGYSRNRNEGTANLSQASYLQKPYQPTKMGRLVRDILHGQEKRAVSQISPSHGGISRLMLLTIH